VLTTKMGLGIIVLLLVNKNMQTVDRITLSQTDMARGALQMTPKKFEEIRIPLNDQENIIAAAIREKEPQQTDDWKYLFIPELSPEQARFNQVGAGVYCSFVYPLITDTSEAKGALIFSHYKLLPSINNAQKDFMSRYSKLAANYL
jgi:hypothetical protein